MNQARHYIPNCRSILNKMQLFCFTHAGGKASFFDTIETEINQYSVVKFEYPGHGNRYKEPFCSTFEDMVSDVLQQFENSYIGGLYAFFGYSMGVLVLVEVLRRLINSKHTLPIRVFIAAHEPLPRKELSFKEDGCFDDQIKSITLQFGGIPQKLISNNSFWRLYLPIYRSDYKLIRQYMTIGVNLKTDIPATVFYSSSDTPTEKIQMWGKHFIGDCFFYEFSGTHFFIQNHHKEMAQIIDSSSI